jgi:cardiolipin synthase A/B
MLNLWPSVLNDAPILGWYLLAFNILAAAFIIFYEKQEPEKTVSWLLVLFALPGVGFLAYLMLGRDQRKRKFRGKRVRDRCLLDAAERQIEYNRVHSSLAPRQQEILQLGFAATCLVPSTDNRVRILTTGEQKFGALLAALQAAQHHIHLEYFIWQRDQIGREMEELLQQKAREGVEVRLLLDGFGSWRISRRVLRHWRARGIQASFFFPVTKAGLLRINYRDHRKIVVVDGRIAFTGGFNVGDNYLGRGRLGPWRDTHLQIEGTAVHDLQSIFLGDWEFATGENVAGAPYFPPIEAAGQQLVQISPSGPDSAWANIRFMYFRMITSATRSVWLTTPYFIPDRSLMTALETRALAGVDVRIITPGRPDHPPVIWAGRTFMRRLIEAGVKFYEYQNGFIHAKVLTVDENIASVGTANFDIRSLEMDFEVNALLIGREITAELNRQFEQDLAHSRPVSLDEFINRPLVTRLKESAARLASPLF